MKLTFEAPRIDCRAGSPVVVRILDERGRRAAGAKIVWGTSEMLADIPETMLPAAMTGEDGSVRIITPSREPFLVRAAGPRLASWWQKVVVSQTVVSVRASEAMAVATRAQLAGSVAATRSIVEVEPVSVVAAADDIRSWAVSERDAIALLPLPRMPVRYTAWSDEAAARSGITTTEAFPRTLSLPRGGRVDGRLITTKSGLRDAMIEAVFQMPGAPRGLRRRARSDVNGRFAVRGLAAGPVQLIVRKPGYASVLRMLKVEGSMAIDDIVMRPARTVTVHVIDRGGRPVASASVRTSEGLQGRCDANGMATLDGVPAGEDVKLTVSAHSFRTASVVVAVDAKGKVDVVLFRGVRVLASIFKAGTHEPAGPGNVMITNNGGRRMETFDSSGTIDIGGLASGTLALEIRAAGSMPYPIAERTVRDDEEINLGKLFLPKGGAMTGRLIARNTSDPIANAHIRALRRTASGPILSFVMRDWVEATSGEDGAFAIAGVQPGPQVLLIEANGFASRVVTADVRQDADEPLDLGSLDLDRAHELIVNCTPVRRCGNEARLLLASNEFPWATVSGSMQDGTAHVLPAPSGTATLRLLNKGQIVEERSIDISSQSDSTTVDIKLASTNVTGTVISRGRPRAGGRVTLERAAGSSHVMPVYLERCTAEGQIASDGAMTDMPEMQAATVDDAGHFLFADVRPGAYRASYYGDRTSSPPTQVTVPEMGNFDFTIDLPPGEIRGRVVDADAAPVGRAIVEIHDANSQQAVAASDESGEFSIGGLAPGHVIVRATNNDREGSAEAEIEPPKTATVEIVLHKKEQVKSEIAVVTPNGQPLVGAAVFLLGSGAFPAGMATTDINGIATFPLSESLIAPAAAYSANYGWAWMDPRSIGSEDAARTPMRMSSATGSLVVSSNRNASIELFTPSGIAVTPALSMLGVPITAAPGSDARVPGLPPGTYTLQAGTYRASAEVQAGKDARVSIH
ncbi:MAG TPA: carboxypeptidase-like regulatory domain-containing protein [Thermoanaerobaculia bacterium]